MTPLNACSASESMAVPAFVTSTIFLLQFAVQIVLPPKSSVSVVAVKSKPLVLVAKSLVKNLNVGKSPAPGTPAATSSAMSSSLKEKFLDKASLPSTAIE